MLFFLRKMAIGCFIAAFAMSASAQSSQTGMGTWKLNVAKSKFSPGPAPKSLVAKFEPAGKGVKLTTETVGADGKTVTGGYTANYDGKDNPLAGSPIADTVSLKRVDANTTERTDKKNGKVVQTLTRTIAKDGKSFTVRVKGTNPKGEAINNVLLFEKQ